MADSEPSTTSDDDAQPTLIDKRLRKGYEAICGQLQPNETVVLTITGSGMPVLGRQAIYATEQRAFVYKRGALSGNTFGAQINSFEYRHLTGVEVVVGLMYCSVVLRSGGDRPVDNSPLQSFRRGGKMFDPTRSADNAPNAIGFDRPDRKSVEAAVGGLRTLIAQDCGPSDPFDDPLYRTFGPGGPSGTSDATRRSEHSAIASTIQQLAGLRDEGLLTNDEFETKKAELLRRI